VRAANRPRLPVVLTAGRRFRSVLQRLYGVEALVHGLLYGSGLRLNRSPAAAGARS